MQIHRLTARCYRIMQINGRRATHREDERVAPDGDAHRIKRHGETISIENGTKENFKDDGEGVEEEWKDYD